MDVAEHELQALYTWVDDIPLSRPKRNIARDFSDGVLMAEVVHHFFPKLVELHNYSSANSFQQKMYNWNTLNAKVFKRLGFIISKPDCEDVANCVASAVERVLKLLRTRIDSVLQEDDRNNGPVMQSYAQPPQAAAVSAQRPQAGPQAPAYNTAFNNTAAVLPMVPAMTAKMQATLSAEVLAEREQTINELRETNQILETKVRKLEQLVRLKDAKIQTLQAKLTAAGLA